MEISGIIVTFVTFVPPPNRPQFCRPRFNPPDPAQPQLLYSKSCDSRDFPDFRAKTNVIFSVVLNPAGPPRQSGRFNGFTRLSKLPTYQTHQSSPPILYAPWMPPVPIKSVPIFQAPWKRDPGGRDIAMSPPAACRAIAKRRRMQRTERVGRNLRFGTIAPLPAARLGDGDSPARRPCLAHPLLIRSVAAGILPAAEPGRVSARRISARIQQGCVLLERITAQSRWQDAALYVEAGRPDATMVPRLPWREPERGCVEDQPQQLDILRDVKNSKAP